MWTNSKQSNRFTKYFFCEASVRLKALPMCALDLICEGITSCPGTNERTIGTRTLLKAKARDRENNDVERLGRGHIIAV